MPKLSFNGTNDAVEFLRNLEPKQHRQVSNKILDLMDNPRPHDSIELKGAAGHFRTDIGEFRICYRFDDKMLWVVEIGRRNDDDVYDQFKRRMKRGRK